MRVVEHRISIIEVTGYEKPRWFYACRCGKVGKRKRDKAVVEKAGKNHVYARLREKLRAA